MADNHFKINRGLSLVPQASAPSNPSDGDIYYDDTLNKFRKYEDGAWSDIAGAGRLPVTTVTSNTTLAVNTVYLADSTGNIAFTLPATNAEGDEIIILGVNTGTFKIQSNSAVAQVLGYDNTQFTSTMGNTSIFINGNFDYAVIKLRAYGVNEWTTEYHSGTSEFVGNYFGTAADGDVVISSNTSLTSSTDSDMIVKNYDDLTIDSGVELTVSNRCKGLLIYVKGNLIVNGKISMTKRGANVDPVSAGVAAGGLKIRRFTSGGSDTNSDSGLLTGAGAAAISAENNQGALAGDGTVFVIPRAGSNGGAAVAASGESSINGNAGATVTTGQTGGGGAGGAGVGNGFTATPGSGAAGTCFSGGAGGGGVGSADGNASATSGAANGGAGGGGGNVSYVCGAGAGNPAGSGFNSNISPEDGTGGLLIIIVKGTVTIGAAGSIEAKGGYGGGSSGSGNNQGAGGGSGGGTILLLHAGALTNNGTITAAGGTGGSLSGIGARQGLGGAGAAGSVQTAQIGE